MEVTATGGTKTKRLGLGLSHKALSRSALPQVLLKYRIEPSLLRVNGTAVPDGITLRPLQHSSDSTLRLKLYPLAARRFRERKECFRWEVPNLVRQVR
jgi:hypothetical protein